MQPPFLKIHGAGRTVTGSCFEVGFGKRRLLIDCGMFQGPRTLEALNRDPLPFEPARMDAVLLTHAHIDHSGLLPRLTAEGFKGSIWCTAPTAELLRVMLPDAARIQEQEAMRRNRRADRTDEPPIAPLYTTSDAERSLSLIRTLPLEEQIQPVPGFSVRFWNAGHILGSASVELSAGSVRMLFSGDLGPESKAFHAAPSAPSGYDHVICESTYGDRSRETPSPEQRREQLAQEVDAAMAAGGNFVVPVFALERTQELLLDLAMLMNDKRLPHLGVFIDSPLATRATKVFGRFQMELEDLRGNEIFRHSSFHFVESVDESMRLNHLSGAIILSASGMCEAGRIRHHLRHNLPRRDSTILFVGFQAQGTLGRTILDGAERVRISGRDVAVRARIRSIDHYSAHADREELIGWIKARRPVSGSLFLVHGEEEAMTSLSNALEGEFASVLRPEIGESYALPADAPARRLTTGRLEVRETLSRDWQNDYADFAVNLKKRLQEIESNARRREALSRMREVLTGYSDHRARKKARS